MIFQHFLLKLNEANAFIIACGQTKEALLVDAGDFDSAISRFIEDNGLDLTKVFITHDHYDHVDGLPDIADRYNPEVYANAISIAGIGTRQVREGDEISVGTLTGRVVETPGHTPDGLSLVFPGLVFTGDALFAGSVGGTPNERLAREQVDHIRKKIFTLPPDTEIHCGHGPSSTVAIESRYNPFFV